MSRISHSSSQDASAAGAQRAAEAQHKNATAQNARNGAQFAALYRGETNFTYGGNGQQGPSVSSLRAKKMADQLARKRRAEKKQQRNTRRGGGDDDGTEGGDGGHGERLRITRDGGNRGGGGQSHDDHGDDHDSASLPSIKTRSSGTPVPPPSGRLDAIAAQFGPGQEGARNAAVRGAWEHDLLALRDELAANPQMPLDARVLEQSIDLLSVQQRIGQLPPGGGIASLRERAGGSPGVPASKNAAQAGADVKRLPLPERVQRFNLLFGLLWKHADLRRTPSHRARSIDSLSSQRNGVLGRAAAAQSAAQPTAQHASPPPTSLAQPQRDAAPNGDKATSPSPATLPRRPFSRDRL